MGMKPELGCYNILTALVRRHMSTLEQASRTQKGKMVGSYRFIYIGGYPVCDRNPSAGINDPDRCSELLSFLVHISTFWPVRWCLSAMFTVQISWSAFF